MAASHGAERGGALLAVLALAGCESLGGGPPPAGDRYETCTPEATTRIDSARAHIAREEWGPAAGYLREAFALCPEYLAAHFLYQDMALRAGGDVAAAMQSFYAEHFDEASPLRPYLQARLAQDDDTRLKLLQEAVRRDKSHYWAYLSEARILRALGRTAKAFDALENALAARPAFPEARLEEAEVLAELGRFEEAEQSYAEYLRARPLDLVTVRDYARLLIFDLGRVDQARPWVRWLGEKTPDDPELLMDEAAMAWKESRFAAAVELYHRVLALDPGAARAVLNLGNLWYDAYVAAPKAERDAAWVKARAAYRYWLGMSETGDRQDLWDRYVAVPYRLREIDKVVAAGEARAPQLGDF